MPKYVAPESDEKRLAVLDMISLTAPVDIAAGRGYLTQDALDPLLVFAGKFGVAFKAMTASQGERSRETAEREAALERLKTHVRDFRETLRRRVYRTNQPAGVLNKYNLPLDGAFDEPTTYQDWFMAAQTLINGDAEAVAAGFPAMTNPSAAEVAAALTTAKAETTDVAAAEANLDEAQAAVAALRPEADVLIADVMEQIRFALRKQDAASQRRILRLYGAQFRYLPGETPDEAAVPEPVAAPVAA